jgi:hypothetical protein
VCCAGKKEADQCRMKIIVFGANGATGSEVVSQCKAAGHTVVCAVRRPETMKDVQGVEVAKIDFKSLPTLVAAMQGGDVVVSCIGHGGLTESGKFTTLFSESTRAYRAAMREAKVLPKSSRLILHLFHTSKHSEHVQNLLRIMLHHPSISVVEPCPHVPYCVIHERCSRASVSLSGAQQCMSACWHRGERASLILAACMHTVSTTCLFHDLV